MRRRVTRRLTRLKTVYNALKCRKTWCNNDTISIYRNRGATAPEPEINSILIMRSNVPLDNGLLVDRKLIFRVERCDNKTATLSLKRIFKTTTPYLYNHM